MTHTRFYDDHSLRSARARSPPTLPERTALFVVDWSTNFDRSALADLMSSVDDLLLWDRNFYGNRLGKGTLLKEMQTRGVLNSGKQISYALGLEIGTYRGLPIVEHGGALFGYRTEILRFPEQRFTVLCLCNLSSADPSGLSHKVADVYLEKSLQPSTIPLRPAAAEATSDPSPFAGKYFDRRDHSVLSFTVSGANLLGWGLSLRRIGPGRFDDPSGDVTAFDNSGGMMKVTISHDEEIFFTGTKIDELHLDDAALNAYAGTYSSTELNATYKLSVEHGSLMLRKNWNSPLQLNPLVRDEFEIGDFGTLVFQRDADGRISGLSVFADRIRNVTFEKNN